MKRWISLLSSIMLIPSVSHAAINLTDSLSLSGFASASASKSDNETPILQNREITEEWCFDCDSTAGLQVDWAITNALRASAQIVKRPQDSFSSPELEWAYIAYEYESLTFRAGRLRLPLFLMSEYYYVSYAYPWFRAPQDIYDTLLGITSYDGVSVTWEGWIQDTIAVSATPYWSTPNKDTYYTQGFDIEIDSDYITGINVQLSYDDTLVNLSSLFSKYGGDITHVDSGSSLGEFDSEMKLFTLGIEQYLGNFHLLAEGMYSQDTYANWYISVDYPIDSFTPYITYGQQRVRDSGEQILVGLRYDVNRYIALNLETQFFNAKDVTGTSALGTSYFTEAVTTGEYDANLFTAGISVAF
ncbi:MAG: sulfate ABC transporter permease [Alteromonadales bacterium]|nr:sulfate ABC transporter permease [Alteromonadales bacterium]